MASFEETLRAIHGLKEEGIVAEYAIAGGMALAFWIEAIPTYDLDVLISLPASAGPLISLEPIHNWARRRSYAVDSEHIVIAGVPVQFLPSPTDLASEAIATAASLRYAASIRASSVPST